MSSFTGFDQFNGVSNYNSPYQSQYYKFQFNNIYSLIDTNRIYFDNKTNSFVTSTGYHKSIRDIEEKRVFIISDTGTGLNSNNITFIFDEEVSLPGVKDSNLAIYVTYHKNGKINTISFK
jgi:hypothetical protein